MRHRRRFQPIYAAALLFATLASQASTGMAQSNQFSHLPPYYSGRPAPVEVVVGGEAHSLQVLGGNPVVQVQSRPTSDGGPVYDGLPRQVENRVAHDPFEAQVQTLDRLINSSTVQRIIKQIEEIAELKAQLRIQQAQIEMKNSMSEQQIDRLSHELRASLQQLAESRTELEKSAQEAQAVRQRGQTELAQAKQVADELRQASARELERAARERMETERQFEMKMDAAKRESAEQASHMRELEAHIEELKANQPARATESTERKGSSTTKKKSQKN